MFSTRQSIIALVVTITTAIGLAAPADAAKDYRAERYDVAITVEPGGGLVVTEHVRFVFGGDTFTRVYRGLPTRRIDGLTITDVAMDGRTFTPGKGAGQYQVSEKDGKRQIVWHFATVSASAHDFDLTYRVAGVVRFEAAEDLLEWNALPTSHDYPIGCASLTVSQPDGARLLEPPTVQPGPMPTVSGREIRVEQCGFAANAGWLLRARFEPRSVVTAPTDWQRRAAQASRVMPLFVGLGGMLLIAGIGTFVVFGLNHRSHARGDARQVLTTPPDTLPANLGAALTRRGRAAWSDAFATIMTLAERGVVRIEQSSGSNFLKRADFVVAPNGPAKALRPSEQAIWAVLFTHKGSQRESVKFSELGRVFGSTSRWKTYSKAVEAELRAHGFYDREREQTRTRVTVAGIVTLAAGFLGLIAAVPFVNEYGGATLSIGIALFATGITGLITGQSLTPLTDEGERRAGQWLAYSRHLKALPRATGVSSPEAFNATLPLAVAFGAGLAWTKALQKNGLTSGPTWLRLLPGEESSGAHMAATIAMLSSANSAGHAVDHASGGGVSAGGAAGGGTSGAS
jgi:hypothetical protein